MKKLKKKLEKKINKYQKMLDIINGLEEENFVLPEKWFFRFKTKEVFNFFKEDGLKNFHPEAGITNLKINPFVIEGKNYNYLCNQEEVDAVEITFDQFKKYVLNK